MSSLHFSILTPLMIDPPVQWIHLRISPIINNVCMYPEYIVQKMWDSIPEIGQETMRWRSTHSPVHSGSRGGTGCSRAPAHPAEEAGSDHTPGPSSSVVLCRPPGPAALKISPVLITYHVSSFRQYSDTQGRQWLDTRLDTLVNCDR